MIRKGLKYAGEWCEEHLRRLCKAMNPDTRVYAIVIALILFAALSLYTIVTAIYNIGKSDGKRLRIEHIQNLNLKQSTEVDSLRINSIEDERESRKSETAE